VYFYIGRELVPALVIFTVAFVSLGLLTLGLFVAWKAGKQIVLVLSRNLTPLEAQSQMTRRNAVLRVASESGQYASEN
jgi:hypothetical protein